MDSSVLGESAITSVPGSATGGSGQASKPSEHMSAEGVAAVRTHTNTKATVAGTHRPRVPGRFRFFLTGAGTTDTIPPRDPPPLARSARAPPPCLTGRRRHRRLSVCLLPRRSPWWRGGGGAMVVATRQHVGPRLVMAWRRWRKGSEGGLKVA
jgi:hypothetical protein